jgi:hypothetical protein
LDTVLSPSLWLAIDRLKQPGQVWPLRSSGFPLVETPAIAAASLESFRTETQTLLSTVAFVMQSFSLSNRRSKGRIW